MTEVLNYVSVKAVEESVNANLNAKTEISLNGGGSSPIHIGADLLIMCVHAKEHTWGAGKNQYTGYAFTAIDAEGELQWVGASALKGSLAYKEDPGAGAWEKNPDQTYWIWQPVEEKNDLLVKWGIGQLLKHWEADSEPKACVRVKVDDVKYFYSCNPIKVEGNSKPSTSKGGFTKSAKTWTGEAHYATPEEIQEFVAKAQALHPENVIPESWQKAK